MRITRKKIMAFLIASTMVATTIPWNYSKVYADNNAKQGENEKVLSGFIKQNTYDKYIEQYKDALKPQKEISIKGNSYSSATDASVKIISDLNGKSDVLQWDNGSGFVEWEVDVPEAGLYNLSMSYYPLVGKGRDIELGLYIDGKVPFDIAESFHFHRIWKNKTAIERDERGNDIRPKLIEASNWIEEEFTDFDGLNNGALQFYFTKGKHKLGLKCVREALTIDSIKLFQEQSAPSYKEVSNEYSQKGYKPGAAGYIFTRQGEDTNTVSQETLYPMYDRTSPATEPNDPSKVRLNTIGSSNWKYPGQWITWKVDVNEDGLYNIGIKSRQNLVRGMNSTRKLYIDGKVPFKEMENVLFPYSTEWYMKTLGGDTPYQFYLTKGTHEIKLEVNLGNIAETLRNIDNDVYQLNYLYRKIIMITGSVPDPYNDYYLDTEISGLLDGFKKVSESLNKEENYVSKLTGASGSEATFLKEIASQLESFIKDPDTIPKRLDRFKSNVSSLSDWVLRLKEQPLEIDYLVVASSQKSFPKPNAGILNKIEFGTKAFVSSFFENYNSIGNVSKSKKTINVWVGAGRDQAQIIKSMVDDLFTPSTGIDVNLSLVDTGNTLIQATLGGKGPDVAMLIPKETPVNLAMRGALVDLSKFNGFKDVTKRFQASAMIPYEYEGGYYALPETQDYNMLFYRKDIFQELGIKAPTTWEEFYSIIPIIQKNNMQIGIPESQNMFETLLFQRGGQVYKDDKKTTALDQPQALDAYKEWTGFYTQYSFPLLFDFYSRFRTGEMPIGIVPYTTYNQLSVAAPELRNLWEMLPIPGTKAQDGSINRKEGANGSGAIMMKGIKDEEAGYEFIKWWTSAEVQARYGSELEAVMGPAARYNTANIEAFNKLPWSKVEADKLTAQWGSVWDIPQIPGNYYLTRSLSNAFRKVVYNYENPREVLFKYNQDINREIERKRTEFGLDK
jgi:ABC-type glycerol-3-phosphate transport system substrate-binding protein